MRNVHREVIKFVGMTKDFQAGECLGKIRQKRIYIGKYAISATPSMRQSPLISRGGSEITQATEGKYLIDACRWPKLPARFYLRFAVLCAFSVPFSLFEFRDGQSVSQVNLTFSVFHYGMFPVIYVLSGSLSM